MTSEGTVRVTYLANTVPNKESLSPKGFTNRRSGPIYFESKVLRAECVTLDSNEKQSVECRSKEQRRAFTNKESFELAAMLS